MLSRQPWFYVPHASHLCHKINIVTRNPILTMSLEHECQQKKPFMIYVPYSICFKIFFNGSCRRSKIHSLHTHVQTSLSHRLMIYDVYAHLGIFQKQHKSQNIFWSPHIFQFFLPKRERLYTKVQSQSVFLCVIGCNLREKIFSKMYATFKGQWKLKDFKYFLQNM